MLLLICFISPVLAALAAAVVVFAARISGTPIAPLGQLFSKSATLAVTGAVVALLYTVVSAIWYERTTGFSAGNAPLGWMFVYGPLGVAFGQLAALVLWWFKRPRQDVA